jgi:hypothetical protein
VVYVIRADLTDPDVRLFTSPRLDDHVLNVAETGGYTVTDFLVRHRLQVAVNAGLFSPQEYYLPAGTPMDIAGLAVSEGVVVSEQEGPDNAATLAFSVDNEPRIIATNWPAVPTGGLHTAVSGSYPLLVGGVNLGAAFVGDRDFIHRTNPRTVMGFSREPRRLYIVVIDGRQPGYSVGANDFETGAWLAFLGATDGINLDGGGSSTLVVEESTGDPRRVNRPSAVADSGKERTVGGHFGIYAPPLPGAINDIQVEPDDTFAAVSWTTLTPATAAVRYGPDTSMALRVDSSAAPGTRHRVLLSDLTPGTRYYFTAIAKDVAAEQVSQIRSFVTTNHIVSGTVFGMEKEWRYAYENLDGVAWMAPDYQDAGWPGVGPGLLWVDGRGAARDGVEPATTRLPIDTSTGFPHPTYYFRTWFDFPASPDGAALRFRTFIDDGAVFYLNGVEVKRFRMEEPPVAIAYEALAISFGCSGDATCAEDFEVAGDAALPLRQGLNLLAVEVHNYNARSPDTTFGMELGFTVPRILPDTLRIERGDGIMTLRWQRPGFVLQEAASAAGPWSDIAGSAASISQVLPAGVSVRFYRLYHP